MPAQVFQFGFDARLAGAEHAGIGRYSENLLRAVLEEHADDPRIDWSVFLNRQDQLPWINKHFPNVKRYVIPVRHYSVAEQTLWWRQLESFRLDLLHVPHFNVPLLYRRPFTMTIHDLLWHRRTDRNATTLPGWQHRIKHRAYKLVSESALKRAQKIFVPTEVVKTEVTPFLKSPSKIVVTSEGLNDWYRSLPLVGEQKRSDRKKERAPYCMYTGSLYPHKNIAVVLRALQHLPDWKLKVASTRNIFIEQTLQLAKVLGVEKQVEFLGYVADEKLIGLYKEAAALIQPSFSEGFGLTGLEAMAAGTPVIASDIPVFHEVYKDHAEFFDAESDDKLAKLLQKSANQPLNKKELLSAQKYAQGFSWHQVAEIFWQEIEPYITV